MRHSYKWPVCIFAFVWFTLACFTWFKPAGVFSESERRKLEQLPPVDKGEILSGKFMNSFESYAQDQFPSRFLFRNIKAYTRFYLLGQKDNNDIFIEDGYAVKLEHTLSESSIFHAASKFETIYRQYLEKSKGKIYLSIIPDKGYFVDKNYPTMNYERLFEIMKENTNFATYMDIASILTIDDYYKTDLHWKQENLMKIAEHMNLMMGNKPLQESYHLITVDQPFYGVYYGHSALPLKADEMKYLSNDFIDHCTVYHVENENIKPVYDLEQSDSYDPYNIFLSGPSPILHISNPNSNNDKELVIFRDSFASSLAPLLLENYSKITLIDIRYIASDYLGEYMSFDGQDILFLYSTVILNSSSMLK